MRLALVRHPQPDVASGICYGMFDMSTSIEANAQVAASLCAVGLPGPLSVYASPLAGCAKLAAARDLPVTLDARLAEMGFRRAGDARMGRHPRAEVDAWAADLLHYRPDGGENVLDVACRVAAFAPATVSKCRVHE